MSAVHRSRIRPIAIAFVLIAVLSACTNGAEPETSPDTAAIPPARTVLRVGADAWPACLNPLTCDSPALREQVLVHVLPVAFEVDADDEYRPSPVLAAEPTGSTEADGTFTITYEIADDARWNDGRRITSSDVAGTWRAIMTTPGADTEGYALITAVDDADPAVAVVTLSEPWGRWRDLFGGTGGWILQADAFGATTDLSGQFSDALPFGAGPFQLAAWDGDVAVLTENESYWVSDRLAEVDQIRIERVDVAGLGDALTYDVLLPTESSSVEPPPDFDDRRAPTSIVTGVWFDQRDPLLSQLLYRQVLTAVIDPVALADAAAESRSGASAVDCLGWLPSSGPWCDIAAPDGTGPALDLAEFVLAGEGWLRVDGGPYQRDGGPLSVTVFSDPADAATVAVVDALVAQLDGFGLVVRQMSLDRAGWLAPRPPESATGIGVYGVDVGLGPWVESLYGCVGGLDTSVVAWCPEPVVAAASALERSVDPAEQAALVGAIADAVQRDAVGVAVATSPRPYLVKPERVPAVGAASIWAGPLAALWDFTVAS